MLAVSGAAARAGDLVISVRDQKGAPVADAIVTLDISGPPGDAPPQTVTIDQKREAFSRLVTLLRPGDSLRFSNSDLGTHHVYSFSALNPFDMLVKPGQTSQATLFERAGLASVGCNVHDNMLTYVFVSAATFAASTGADGAARIKGAPEGATTLTIWHPNIAGEGRKAVASVTVGVDETKSDVQLKMRPSRRQRASY